MVRSVNTEFTMSFSLTIGNLWAKISKAVGGGPQGVEEKTYATGVRGMAPTVGKVAEKILEKTKSTKDQTQA